VPSPGRFSSADQLTTIVGRLITRAGGAFDGSTALWEGTLPEGAHVVAILPPVALRGPIIEVRRTGRAPVTGESLVEQGVLSREMLDTLRSAVENRKNVVIVGGNDGGVGSVVSMVANLGAVEDRVLAIEASPELALAAQHAVRLSASSHVGLATLLAQAPRLRADRIVIDGVSGPEAREALLLLASRGSACVLGVRSTPNGSPLDHVEALAALGGAAESLPRLLSAAVHVLVKVARDPSGVRRIVSISEITSEEGIPTAQELFQHSGDFQATGKRATFLSS
jgi:pilus assembly protein CpaF